jgi:hypothetical protein
LQLVNTFAEEEFLDALDALRAVHVHQLVQIVFLKLRQDVHRQFEPRLGQLCSHFEQFLPSLLVFHTQVVVLRFTGLKRRLKRNVVLEGKVAPRLSHVRC